MVTTHPAALWGFDLGEGTTLSRSFLFCKEYLTHRVIGELSELLNEMM